MKIILAPNAFKGSISARDAALALQEGLILGGYTGDISLCPVGDGGDGTGMLIREYMKATTMLVNVKNPIGKTIKAPIGWVDETNTAIIEMADTSGLRLLNPIEYNPLKANTYGLGEMIIAALDLKAKEILICIGGSATVDGGVGMLQALGVQFINKEHKQLVNIPKDLETLETIDITTLDRRLFKTKITILCDVQNKLLGANGAASVFGPQKGAGPKDVIILENGLSRLNSIVENQTKKKMSDLTFSGAAGGVAAALSVFCNARSLNGIDYFLQLIQFEKELENADWVITGEGAIDSQTLEGKAPMGVAKMALKKNIPVIVVAGKVPKEPNLELNKYFKQIICINDHPTSLEETLKNTRKNLIETGRKIVMENEKLKIENE